MYQIIWLEARQNVYYRKQKLKIFSTGSRGRAEQFCQRKLSVVAKCRESGDLSTVTCQLLGTVLACSSELRILLNSMSLPEAKMELHLLPKASGNAFNLDYPIWHLLHCTGWWEDSIRKQSLKHSTYFLFMLSAFPAHSSTFSYPWPLKQWSVHSCVKTMSPFLPD